MTGESPYLSQNLWERYGFRGDPFNTNPLAVSYDDALSVVRAYVPRQQGSDPGLVLHNFLRGTDGGRVVIEGEAGVGKTTFVNYHRHQWEFEAKPALLSPPTEIEVARDWTTARFLLSLLSSLCGRIRLDLDPAAFQRSRTLREVSALTGVHREEGGGIGLGITVAGVGGTIRKSQAASASVGEVTVVDLQSYLTELVEIARRELGCAGVIFHLDNLELLRHRGHEHLNQFFEDIRNSIQEPNVYFIFVGYTGMFQEVIAPSPRVRSIFLDTPIRLEPLSREQVHEIIAVRYDILAIEGKNWIKPVEDEVIDFLYETYDGKIRNVMNSVKRLVMNMPDSYAGTLGLREATELLDAIQRSEVEARLTPTAMKVFLEAVALRKFRPSALAERTGKSKQATNKYLKKLLEQNYVWKAEKKGRSQYYEVDPRFLILSARNPGS